MRRKIASAALIVNNGDPASHPTQSAPGQRDCAKNRCNMVRLAIAAFLGNYERTNDSSSLRLETDHIRWSDGDESCAVVVVGATTSTHYYVDWHAARDCIDRWNLLNSKVNTCSRWLCLSRAHIVREWMPKDVMFACPTRREWAPTVSRVFSIGANSIDLMANMNETVHTHIKLPNGISINATHEPHGDCAKTSKIEMS